MKTLVLVAPKSGSREWPLALLGELGEVDASEPEECSQGEGDDWIRVSVADDVRAEYEPDDLAKIDAMVPESVFYLVEARQTGPMERYVGLLPEDAGVLLDNDHGWVAPVGEYKEAIRKGPGWLYAEGGGQAL